MKILFYTPYNDAPEWLSALAEALPHANLREWRPGDSERADYAIAWRAPREFFAGRPDLRAVFNLGAGVDALLALEHAHPGTLPKDALLVRLEDSGMAAQMAEYVTHAVLRYMRRFDEYERLQAERRWHGLVAHPRATFTVGVMGLGMLGAPVVKTLVPFGLPVRGYSRSEKRIEGVATYAGTAQFDAFLDGVKVLVNLLPSTPDTNDVLNRHTFAKLARGAYLVNVARGAHLVEGDLLDALKSGQIAAATLDVFRQEPLAIDHPFWSEPRITITPHSSAETQPEDSAQQIARKIEALERGEAITGVVDFVRGY
jgi:glyoxylate/hydroxypyruvate reductase A